MRMPVVFFSCLSLCIITLSASADVQQWTAASGGNEHYYEAVLCPDGVTWTQADSLASASGSGWHLATITSPEENAFVYALFADDPQYWVTVGNHGSGPVLGAYHIGPTAYDYEWVTGEPFDYTNWGLTAPYGNGARLAYFGYNVPTGTDTWNDIPDSYYWWIHGYIRENSGPYTPAGCDSLTQYLSDFNNATLQGWTKLLPFCGTMHNPRTGGNNGGYIHVTDSQSGCGGLGVVAPSCYSGDFRSFSGVRWDEILISDYAELPTRPALVGADGTTYMLSTGYVGPVGVWRTRSGAFIESLWEVIDGTGSLSFDSVLANVTMVWVDLDVSTYGSEESGIDNFMLILGGTPTVLSGVPEDNPYSLRFSAHPSPFNPTTEIQYSLPIAGEVSLAIHDVTGRLVATLVDGLVDAGDRLTTWDGRSSTGDEVASGTYFVRLESAGELLTQKIILVR